MSIILNTERLTLRELTSQDAEKFCDFLLRNKEFFRSSGPVYDKEYESVEYHRKMLERSQIEGMDGRHYKFGIFLKDDTEKVIGSVSLSNIVMGNFRSCYLGYRIDGNENSKGYATEALRKVVDFGFEEITLHRIEANIMPRNKPSIRVIEKLGFTYEGDSKQYLRINGLWEDHSHYVILNDKVE